MGLGVAGIITGGVRGIETAWFTIGAGGGCCAWKRGPCGGSGKGLGNVGGATEETKGGLFSTICSIGG